LIVLGLLWLASVAQAQDKNFYVFLCFGQSNMDGFPGLLEEDKTGVDERFQVLAAVDFPEQQRTKGQWYRAVPPLARPGNGICPVDYFGRTLVAKLPPNVRVGVVNVAVPGCKIELFDETKFQEYAAAVPGWMKNVIKIYGGDPYQYLVAMGREAQKAGIIKGILLHQGESNTGDKEWPVKVKTIYERLLKDLNLQADQVPLLAGEVVAADQKGACAPMNYIIDSLPKTIPTAHVVSAAGCTAREPDHLHFTPAGYRELGKRYAETMLPLLNVK
jgi:alpha-L-fucosidase 2